MVPKPQFAALQRAHGAGALEIRATGGYETLARLYQSGSSRIRFSPTPDAIREAVLINTAGGIAGGDRFEWSAAVGPNAKARVVTQACEKVYRSTGKTAELLVTLSVGRGASLEWLPQETILFDGSRLRRRFELDIEPGGRLLALEGLILGRHAMGESDILVHLRDRWRVRLGGRLIFADDLRLEGDDSNRSASALLGGARAFASILLVAEDAEARLDALAPLLEKQDGASAFGGKLFCRFLARDGISLRRRLTAAMAILRDNRPTPRLWTV